MIACPNCKAATHVEETRGERRRRACATCGRKVTTIEVIVDGARRYDKIAVMPRKDLEQMLKLTGKAIASLVGTEGVLALISDAGMSVEATPASNVVADESSNLEESASTDATEALGTNTHDHEASNGAEASEPTENALTEEELRAIGVDPDDEEQLAALGLIVQGSD